MKSVGVWFLCFMIAFAPGCGILTDDQESAVLMEIQAQLDEGLLTPEQAAFLRGEVERDGEWDWDAIGAVAGGIILSVVGAITGVRLTRGPAKPLDKSQANVLAELLEDARKRKVKKDVAEASAPSVLDAG